MEGLGKDDLEELKEALRQEFTGYSEVAGGKNYRFHHLETTHAIAVELMDRIDQAFDRRVVEIAVLFHDIGRKEDIRNGEMDPFNSGSHAETGAETVGKFIRPYVDKGELEKIQRIIRNHHSEAETMEGRLVQDADELENFGVSNLWRQFHYACEHGRTLEESISYFWNTAQEEFETQLEKLHFNATREAAKSRLEKQKEAVTQIEKEFNAEDI